MSSGWWTNTALEHAEAVQLLLDAGADVDGTGVNKMTPLQIATGKRNSDLVKILLNSGADLNAPPAEYDEYKELQEACTAGNIDLIKTLWDPGADINVPLVVEKGDTALQAAVPGHGIQLLLCRCRCW
jgi:ankyrin repeat protein